MHTSLDGFSNHKVTINGSMKTVLRIGNTGPSVIVVHELPGITPPVADFARYVAQKGFQVSLPSLTGTPGQAQSTWSLARAVITICVSKEFSMFAAGRSSPIVDWLRAFGKQEHARCGGPGIGVVGMCFSGGFALGMAVDPHVLAPVMSQPSMPVRSPLKRFNGASVDVSTEDLAIVRKRLEEEQDLCVLAYRFSNDKLVPKERFPFLSEQLGESFIGVTFDSSPDNATGQPANAHSVLTQHLVPEARNEVVALFERQLLNR
jgi:dienelactone hydrolase